MSNTLNEKGRDFSMRIGELVRFFRENGEGFPLCERLLVCGVTAGLSIRRGKAREAAELIEEADYIIEIAAVAGYLAPNQDAHIRADCESLLSTLKGKTPIAKQEEK